MLQLSGLSTPGAASPTLSVDQCESAGPGSCRTSQPSPGTGQPPHFHQPGKPVVPDALAGTVSKPSVRVGPADHAVVGAGVGPRGNRGERYRLAGEAITRPGVISGLDGLS